jgi:hypothetical protein
MSKSNVHEAALLDLEFLNTDAADIGDSAGLQNSAAAGSFYVALHTASPGEAGDQTTNEITTAQHGAYARQAIARSGAGFSRSGNVISNVAEIAFPVGTAGTPGAVIAKWFSIGSAVSGAGVLRRFGELLGPGVVVTADATANTFNATTHGFTAGQAVQVRVTDGTMPGGVTSGTTYYVINANANDFQISTTVGGSAVDITSTGNGTIKVHLDKQIPVGLNTQPKIAAGGMTVSED